MYEPRSFFRRGHPRTGREVLDNVYLFALRRVPGAAADSSAVRCRGPEEVGGVQGAGELPSSVDPREDVPDAGALLPSNVDRDEETGRGQYEIQERGGAAAVQRQAAPLVSV